MRSCCMGYAQRSFPCLLAGDSHLSYAPRAVGIFGVGYMHQHIFSIFITFYVILYTIWPALPHQDQTKVDPHPGCNAIAAFNAYTAQPVFLQGSQVMDIYCRVLW